MTTTLETLDRGRLSARVGFLRALGSKIAVSLTNGVHVYRQRAAKRRSLVRLADLEDWQLDDIGVTRAEVERVLGEAGIHRDPPQLFER